MNTKKRSLGKSGEEKALNYLQKKGYHFLTQNYRSPFGEIDLIFQDKQHFVFVEVKTRTSEKFGSGMEAVDCRKQQRMIKGALYYLGKHDHQNKPFRFDVISILAPSAEKEEIVHLVGAFP